MFADKQAEGARRIRTALTPALVPGETFVGAMFATRKSAFSGKVFAIGVTEQRLILLEVDRAFAPKSAPPVTVRPSDIRRSSLDGWGGGVGHFLSSAGTGAPEIRFDTADAKYRFMVIGGVTGESLMGADYMAGLEAVCNFISAATT